MKERKVILVESDDAGRESHSGVLGVIGYKVLAYRDRESALAHIKQNGHAPFVAVVPFDSAAEIKGRLNEHSQETGVDYGVVCVGLPNDPNAKIAMKSRNIPYVRRGFDLNRVSEEIDAELARIENTRAAYENLSSMGKMLLYAGDLPVADN